MEFYFGESQPTPHNALTDAECVKRICQRYSHNLGHEKFAYFLQELFDDLDYELQSFTKSFDQFVNQTPYIPPLQFRFQFDHLNFLKL